MTRWSLKNIFRDVTHEQFNTYTTQFKQAAEKSFGTECKLEIRALSAPKVYTTYCDDDLQSNLDSINDSATLLVTDKLSDMTEALWKAARYVEITLRPADPEKAPRYAFAHAEFKGTQPEQATFYIQPDGEDAKAAIIAQQKHKRIGDGFDGNGRRSGGLPSGLFW